MGKRLAAEVQEGFCTAKEFAARYGISIQAVSRNCKSEKYHGAFQDWHSGRWYIPKDTVLLGINIKDSTEKHITQAVIKCRK